MNYRKNCINKLFEEEVKVKKKVVILGGTGAGLIAASIIDRDEHAEVIGFLNDLIPVGDNIVSYNKKIRVIGKTSSVSELLEDENTFAFVAYEGISDPYKSYDAWKSLNIPKEKYYNVIDKFSVVPWEYCNIGNGVMIAQFSQISPGATLSNNSIMLGNSFLGHDSFVDEFSHLTTNSVVGAHVKIGKGVTIGMNATIRGGVTIGDFSLIGAGAVVLDDVTSNTIVAGNPAKIIRERGELNYLKRRK